MPELAEVEFYRRQWEPHFRKRIVEVRVHPGARVFRGTATDALVHQLHGASLVASAAHGKQMHFRSNRGGWLGLHLGMTGELSVCPPSHPPLGHDHLVLRTKEACLVFRDPRMFGRVLWHHGPEAPGWWRDLPPTILSPAFTPERLEFILARHRKAPLKAVLLKQEHFPGIGNWMADEILWRAALHPALACGRVASDRLRPLWKTIRQVARDALRIIGTDWKTPPDSWLFNHRWSDGGRCPRTGGALVRETIAGRTTCWSPARQPSPTLQRRRG
jgi:formamidopyrimidine-DNA glycosylase